MERMGYCLGRRTSSTPFPHGGEGGINWANWARQGKVSLCYCLISVSMTVSVVHALARASRKATGD